MGMEHLAKGNKKIFKKCKLPLTGVRVVDLLITDMAVFTFKDGKMTLTEVAEDTTVDVKLNKHIWSRGVKGCPTRIRVRLEMKRNEDEDADEELYTVCTHVRVPANAFKGLHTKRVSADEE